MAAVSRKKPHVLAVPLPAQGHVKPLMSLCREIAKHGVKVTFVNAQSIHNRIASASAKEDDNITLTAVADGLTPDDDPNNPFTLMETLPNTMPSKLTELIDGINRSNPDEKISCVIADVTFAWILDVAEKMGAEPVCFLTSSAACMAIVLHTLRGEGNLSTNISLKNKDAISLCDDIPVWRREELPWCVPDNTETESVLFGLAKQYIGAANKAKWILCNTCEELEPAATKLLPNVLPVGPLHLLDSDAASPANFYSEDASCLSWLDNKPDGSVIYVSFGSLAIFSQQQLHELAFGLELSGRAFLWAIRPNIANGSRVLYPNGFLERVSERGKVVEWAPQNRVLSHPSICCFVSHCGWNSILESMSAGIPFLCWAYFSDQIHNERYICDKWKIGLKIDFDDERIRSKFEIKKKIDMLFSDHKMKENVLKLKEVCAKSVSEGGSSLKNLHKFIDYLKE